MHVKKEVKFKMRDDIATFEESNFDSISIEVISGNKGTIVCESYRTQKRNQLNILKT